ncbi:MAG: hypothetical protein PWQ06_1121 [Anaerophaga sp.]|jgi:hypothetical protein|nr:hypothetical protein [Anaerophaga sp.]
MQTDNRLMNKGEQGLEKQSPTTFPKATPEQIAEIIQRKRQRRIKRNQERSIKQLLEETFGTRWL